MRNLEETFADFMENHNVEDSVAVKQSNERALRYLFVLTGKNHTEIEDMVSYAGYEREKQGFINGFRYAMEMIGATQKVGATL